MYAPPDAYGFVASRPPSACWLMPMTFVGITHSKPSTNASRNQSDSARGW